MRLFKRKRKWNSKKVPSQVELVPALIFNDGKYEGLKMVQKPDDYVHNTVFHIIDGENYFMTKEERQSVFDKMNELGI